MGTVAGLDHMAQGRLRDNPCRGLVGIWKVMCKPPGHWFGAYASLFNLSLSGHRRPAPISANGCNGVRARLSDEEIAGLVLLCLANLIPIHPINRLDSFITHSTRHLYY